MSVAAEDKEVVERMFKAMQTGLTAEDDMMALFSEDAVFTEPFGGEPRTHEGKPAIRACFREMWSTPEPEMTLLVDRIDMDADIIVASWTCSSPVFATPMRGIDRFRIQNGQIKSLEVIVTAMPPIPSHGKG